MNKNFLKTLFLLLGASSALSAVAYNVEVGGAYYNLDKANHEATLTYKLYFNVENAQAYVGDVVIPETFDYEDVTYTVTAVDQRTFFSCSELTSIELPSTIVKIGNNAFVNCTNLKSVNLPENLSTMEYSAFQNCTALEEIEIPSALNTLNNAVFSGCKSLHTVHFPHGLRTINSNAFYDCASLASLELPSTLTTIGPRAFSNCTSLQTLVVPNAVTKISTSAFQDCTLLERVELGRAIQTIDVNCFAGCTALLDVYCSSATPPAEAYNSAFNGTPRSRVHIPNEGIEAYHKVDTWAHFAQLLPLQCAVPTIELGEQSITFATATNLNYAAVSEKFVYTIDVSDICSGTVSDDELDAFGALALTYDVSVRTTVEGCEDSAPVSAQLCWLGSDLLLDDEEAPHPTSVETVPSQRPVLATSRDGQLTLTGLTDGAHVALYDLSGRQLGAATASGESVTFSVGAGQVVVAKVGNSSFKLRVK